MKDSPILPALWLRARGHVHALDALAVLTAAVIALPLIGLLAAFTEGGAGSALEHLVDTVLPRYVLNSVALAAAVGLGVTVVGAGCAWLIAAYQFPGKRILEWALVLPLAMPTYVVAYAYTDFLQYSGPLQSALRAAFDWQANDYNFPDIHSLGGAAFLLTMVLFPYVYLPARAAFAQRSAAMEETARLSGHGTVRTFMRVTLPLARPALVAGAALAIMETLADYGAMSYLAVETFTTGIYKAWFGLGQRAAAVQLAVALLGFVVLLLAIEKILRGRARADAQGARGRPAHVKKLRHSSAWGCALVCSVPVIAGFVLPFTIMLRLAWREAAAFDAPRYLALVANTLQVSALAAFAATGAALLLVYAARWRPGLRTFTASRIAALGYAAPGAVIAVAILAPLAAFDNAIDAWMRAQFGVSTGLLLSGSIAALIYAYVVRFLAVALNVSKAGLAQITSAMDDAARSLGSGAWETLARVHAPLIARSLVIGMLLVFVEALKELPATLVLRPFNFDTLATHAYTLAKDERLGETAAPSLTIVAVSLLPVMFASRALSRRRATN